MAEPLTLNGIIEDLQAIAPQLLQFEKKYKLLSPYFYHLYQTGKLECTEDFQEWAAFHETKLRREDFSRNQLAEALANLPLNEPVEVGEFK